MPPQNAPPKRPPKTPKMCMIRAIFKSCLVMYLQNSSQKFQKSVQELEDQTPLIHHLDSCDILVMMPQLLGDTSSLPV